MSDHLKFYINGAWVDPATPRTLVVINPATEEPFTQISIGSAADVDRAVAAARAAFPKFSQTSKADRIALLKRIIECYRARENDILALGHDQRFFRNWQFYLGICAAAFRVGRTDVVQVELAHS